MSASRRALVLMIVIAVVPLTESRGDVCRYLSESGVVQEAPTLEAVPRQHRARAQCGAASSPDPRDVRLQGTETERRVPTPLGVMNVRWPRAVESCLGRSPSRAVAEAATAVGRAINRGRFDSALINRQREWFLLVLDRRAAAKEIPDRAGHRGHAGFMLPPNKIFIIADNIAGDCQAAGQRNVPEDFLARVLIHEMAHVLEFVLLRDQFGGERFRAEGFARWFEEYATEGSSIVAPGLVASETNLLVQSQPGVSFSPESFNGSHYDYARSALFFREIVARRGIGGLMRVYSKMSNGATFFPAVQSELGIVRDKLERDSLAALSQ
jgi:hypothetical protein